MVRSHSLLHGTDALVTGGAGFIGAHLIRELLNAGVRRVVTIDNLRTGSWQNLPDDPRIEKVTADFPTLGSEDLSRLLEGTNYLFHLAAEKHNQSVDLPERVLEVNVNGTFRLFAAASKAGVRKVIFTSSLYATGRLNLPPMDELDVPEPRTVYGISKLAGEHLLQHFASVSGLRSTAFRLFFVYGPRQYAGSGYKSVIVTNFERILRGEVPTINGDGEQSLDYVHVDDVVQALMLGVVPEADGQLLNIGRGIAVSVSELTEMMLEVAGSSLRPVHAPPDWTAGTHRVCRNEKARAILGWSPTVPMKDGLAGVYAWMKGR